MIKFIRTSRLSIYNSLWPHRNARDLAPGVDVDLLGLSCQVLHGSTHHNFKQIMDVIDLLNRNARDLAPGVGGDLSWINRDLNAEQKTGEGEE